MKRFVVSLSKYCAQLCAVALIPVSAFTVLLIRAPKLLLHIFYYILIALCSLILISMIAALVHWTLLKSNRNSKAM